MISFIPVIYESNFDGPNYNLPDFEPVKPEKVRYPISTYEEPYEILYYEEPQEEIPQEEYYNDPGVTPTKKKTSFEELLKQEGIKVRVTSRFRPGARTKSGHASNHSKKDENGVSKAIDIVPEDGNFERLATQIYSNPRIVLWLKDKGYGILEEVTPEIMRRTGATGKHFHVGPDKAAVLMTLSRLRA